MVFINKAQGKKFTEISKICNITQGKAYIVFKQTIDTLRNDVKRGDRAKKLLDCLRFLYVDEIDYDMWKYPMRLHGRPYLIVQENAVDMAKELFGDGYRIYGFKKLPAYGRRA